MSQPTYSKPLNEVFAMTATAIDEDGQPADLTGYSVVSQVKRSTRTGSEVVFDFEPTIPDPSNGVVVINKLITGLDPGIYYFDIRFIDDALDEIIFTTAEYILKLRNAVSEYPAP